MKIFSDRIDAGKKLAERLFSFKAQHPVVLAIPRGGVPVAFEVAQKLHAPLDLIMVKKIGAPRNPEYAVGAVSEDQKPILNEGLLTLHGLNKMAIEEIANEKIQEIRKQMQNLRGSATPLHIAGKTVLLIDDGIATGTTLITAIKFIRAKNPAKVIVAAPVGARDSVYQLQAIADDVICLETPENFAAVGEWYQNFDQVSDDEVKTLMQQRKIHSAHHSSASKNSGPDDIVQEIADCSMPVRGPQSWEALIDHLGKTRVVMLGESSHGTEEFYSIRRYISERLMKEYGFKFIAVEGDWPACQQLNQYALGNSKERSAIDIMHKFERWPTWMWANHETARLIESMKKLKTEFYGLDVYSLFESIDSVNAWAKQNRPELAGILQERYACFDPFSRDEKAYARYLLQFPEGCRQEVLSNLRNLLTVRINDFSKADDQLFDAQQNARIISNAESYYRAMIFGGPESWNVRDNHMMDTLDILLRRAGEQSKCIVWAHNTHIGDYRATDMKDAGYVNLGGLARERFGETNVKLVGFGTYEGDVLAGPAWDGPETVTTLYPAKKKSFEDYCHQAAEAFAAKRFYSIFDETARSGVLGTKTYPHRAVGVVYQPSFEQHGHNYVPTIPAQRYDCFVFVDQTSALKSIKAQPNYQDLPETWPGGF
ncbi:erythromycin esterase family protein [Bdellovibrio sp. NC01]|uniref:erythromycin esterase family protein n=1 Tax=Bdellovibrio sp. NC01 TaxID=2220073 RepID=UPI0011573979|nr:erythromycin esterase family protein [Bdellovibrio sp. NC01]QDK38676.1 hypothetical protein DOE51_14325 [Bdellovibrio sp. NC01]